MRNKLIIWLLICILGILDAYPSGGQSNKTDNVVLATVGTQYILLSQFADRYTDYLIKSGIDDKGYIREKYIINMTNELVLRYYDDNEKIFTNPEYQKELNWSRKETVLAYLKDQEVYSKIRVSENELRDAFVKVNEEVAARHLYAPTKEEADSLYSLLMHGASFDSLAKQVFTDSVLQNNGGYLGYFTWGDMDPAFEDAAYSLQIGQISKPIKTAYGYSIIKVEDKVVKPIMTENEFLNKKDHLTQVIRIKKMKPYERAYLKSIIDVSKIKFNQKSLDFILNDLIYSPSPESDQINSASTECASYKGRKFTQKEIDDQINGMPTYQKNKITNIGNLKSVIKGIILQDTLYNIAVKKGYDTAAIVNKTYDKLVMDLFMRYKTNEILNKSTVPDSVVYQYYKDNLNSFMSPKEINLRELIVDNKPLADNLKIQLAKGADFGELSREFSIDKVSAGNKGIAGYSDPEKYGYLKDTLWNSPVGVIIGPLRVEKYFGLFEVLGKKASEPLDYYQIKNQVEASVKKQMSQSFMMDYVNKLKKNVDIKIYYDRLWAYKIPGLSDN